MSRVRILNLPNDCTEQALKQHILRTLPASAPQVDITDVAIIRHRNNNSNKVNHNKAKVGSSNNNSGNSGSNHGGDAVGRIRMAFVGFTTVAAAQFVVRYFNHTYFRSSKMVVEVAKAVGDVGVTANERARSARHAQTSSATATTTMSSSSTKTRTEGDGKGAEATATASASASRKRARSAADAHKTVSNGDAKAEDDDGKRSNTTTTTAAAATMAHKELFIRERARATAGPSWAAEVLLPEQQQQQASTTTTSTTTHDNDDAHVAAVSSAHHSAKADVADNNNDDVDDEAVVAAQQQALGAMSDLDFLATLNTSTTTTTTTTRAHDAMATDAPADTNVVNKSDKDDDDAPSDEVALVRTSRRVRLAGIPYMATEEHVKQFASSLVGPVEAVHIPLTRDTRQSKGAAFVRFATADDAEAALQRCRGAIFMGRVVRVCAATDDPYSRRVLERDARRATTATGDEAVTPTAAMCADDGNTGNTTAAAAAGSSRSGGVGLAGSSQYKLRKEMQLREQQAAALPSALSSSSSAAAAAGKPAAVSWNAMYVNSHAAVTAVAQRMGVSAEDVVSVRTRGAAVRAAIAEAYLTTEVQQVLGDEGVDMGVLQDAQHNLLRPRSNTSILVKNIHLHSPDEAAQLTRLFVRYGTVESVAFPASGVLALYRYTHAQDARIAFARLSLKLFQGNPLYLEWAPMGACVDVDGDGEDNIDDTHAADEDKDNKTAATADEGSGSNNNNNNSSSQAHTTTSSSDAVVVYTLFITNIAFGTTTDAFRHFILDACPRLAREPDKYITRLVLEEQHGRAFLTVSDARTFAYCKAKLHGRSHDKRVLSCVASKQTLLALEARARVAAARRDRVEQQHNNKTKDTGVDDDDEDDDDDVRAAATAMHDMPSRSSGSKGDGDDADKDDYDEALSKARAVVVAQRHNSLIASSNNGGDGDGTTATAAVVPAGADPCKLVVKNLPFEATERDVRELFSAFSELRSVRVPRKTHVFSSHRSNNHRGFAFVEFISPAEAARAMRSLRATHLYGRHLVLEYAKLDA